MLKNYETFPKISFDYAIMEKTKNHLMYFLDVSWSDLGTWDSIYEILSKDKNGNCVLGEVLGINTKNSLIIGRDKKLISTIGLDDLIIIETKKALLICKKGESAKMDNLIEKIKL